MKINYLNILTLDDLQNINETDYNEIKTIGEVFKKERQAKSYDLYMGSRVYKTHTEMDMQSYAFEFAFRNKNFKDYEYFKKVLINAEVLLPTNEKLITFLVSRNITRKTLLAVLGKLNKLKKLAQMKEECEDLDDTTVISDKNINYICNLINQYYPCDNYNLIVAKLLEIVVFEKELYLSLEGETQKVR